MDKKLCRKFYPATNNLIIYPNIKSRRIVMLNTMPILSKHKYQIKSKFENIISSITFTTPFFIHIMDATIDILCEKMYQKNLYEDQFLNRYRYPNIYNIIANLLIEIELAIL